MDDLMESAAPAPAVRPRTRRRPALHSLRVAAVQPLCEDAAAVSFDIPAELADEFAFAPGQSLTLRREIDGRDERRSYSICSPAGSVPRIGVRVVPGGLFSAWLVREVRPGDMVDVMAPTGAFTPDLTTPGHHVLIAAGSGITPMLSIAESVLAADSRSTVTLFYGNRRTDTVMFADELADLKDLYPAPYQLAHVLSREPREAEGALRPSGRRAAVGARRLAGRRGGRGPLVAVVRPARHGPRRPAGAGRARRCRPTGSTRSCLRRRPAVREVHHQDTAVVGPVSEVTITLDGRSTTAALPRGRSILDGAQTCPDLPFACKGAVRHLPGPGHRRQGRHAPQLRPRTRRGRRGYVLTCQSFPVTETLAVDYDS